MNAIHRLQLKVIDFQDKHMQWVQRAAERRAEKQWDKSIARFTAMCNEIAGE